MADTLPDIELPANTWVDLYAASGIAVGTRIIAMNKGSMRINAATSAAAPIDNRGAPVAPNETFVNQTGDSGAWVKSQIAGRVSVAVV
jgi:hypothetical protein